jgi:hypothetical protein
MSGDQKVYSLLTLMLCASLVAVVAIMARCSIEVDALQTDASECAKAGGTWHPSADPASRFCEEKRKP